MKLILSLLASFAIVSFIIVSQYLSTKDIEFQMIFCDIGQGDGIYIRAFSQDIVIDGGPAGSRMTECLSRYMPFFDRNIELMVVTHADSDHYAGFLDVMESYTVSKFATSYGDSDVLGYQALLNKLQKANVEVKRLVQGESIVINDRLKMDVLWPPKEFTNIDDDRNNSSLVMGIDFDEFEAILTGDLDKEYLNLLLNDLNRVEVFKLGHHGSKTSTDNRTFETFRPELSIISAGVDNRFGHPHKEVVDVLNKFGLKYLNTQEEGDIVIVSEGKGFQIK